MNRPARPAQPVLLDAPIQTLTLPPLESLAPNAVVQRIQATCGRLVEEVSKVVVGKQEVLEMVTLNLLAGGNVLFEDFPGLAKSLLSDTFGRASGCKAKRIQFTPDLLPSDIVGSNVFDQKTGEFTFRPGPVFTNFLLADEINRAPPKTQAALLETMQERQVTVEGVTRRLEAPYVVLATQNPVEQEGTYPLPEAQMDRFLVKLAMGYPTEDDEVRILERRVQRASDSVEVQAVTNPEEIVWMQRGLERVHIDPVVQRYVVKLVQGTRKHPSVLVGSSPRGSLGLMRLSRAQAALRGRAFVTPDDVKRVAVAGLAHRVQLKPEPRIRGERGEDVVRALLRSVPAPVLRA